MLVLRFPADALGALTRQSQVVLRRQPLVGLKLRLRRRRVRHFENRRRFVHLVEHCDVRHVDAEVARALVPVGVRLPDSVQGREVEVDRPAVEIWLNTQILEESE